MKLGDLLRGLADLSDDEAKRLEFVRRVKQAAKGSALEMLKKQGATPELIEKVRKDLDGF